MKSGKQLLNKDTIILITIITLVIFFIPACEQTYSPILPSALIGIWETDDSQYKNRYIGFDDNQIIFGTGNNKSYTLFVTGMEKNIKEPIIEWTFFCKDIDGNPSEIVIFYQPVTNTIPINGSIRLKNKKTIVW